MILYLQTAASSELILVTISSNVNNGTTCYNQSVELTCHSNLTTENVKYTWTSSCDNFNQSDHSTTITAIATSDPVKYTCTVNSSNGNHGYSTVYISSNGKLYTIYGMT